LALITEPVPFQGNESLYVPTSTLKEAASAEASEVQCSVTEYVAQFLESVSY